MGEFEEYLKEGASALLKGKHRVAIKYFKKAKKVNALDIRPYINLGLAYASAKKHDKSIAIAQEGLKMENHPELYYIIGKAYEEQGRYNTALSYFKKSPGEDEEGRMHQVRVLIKTERLDDARMVLLGIHSDNPNHITALTNLGGMFMESQEYRKAIEILSLAAEIEPHPYTYEKIAHAHSRLGNHEKALEYLQQAIDSGHPDKARVMQDFKGLGSQNISE